MRIGTNRNIDPNVTVCPNYGPNKGRTALMLAAQVLIAYWHYGLATAHCTVQALCRLHVVVQHTA
jgi:hypothetical protein